MKNTLLIFCLFLTGGCSTATKPASTLVVENPGNAVAANTPAKNDQDNKSNPILVQTQQGLVTITDVMIGDTPGDRRLLRVNVEGRTEKEFDIDPGIPKAKVIATYLDANEGDYIVLQTDKGMGACSPTTIYVLTINDLSAFTDKNTPILQLSPYLNECMGDYPTVRFEINENAGGSIGVSVFDHVLENNKWKKRRKQ